MALAVKNTPETTTSQLVDRLSVGIVIGVAYVIGSLVVLFKAVPWLWWSVFAEGFASYALLVGAICVAAVALAFVGGKLLGPHPAPGLKAGIFATLAALLIALLLARLIGGWIEQLTIQGALGLTAMIGMILAGVVAAALCVGAVVLIVRPKSHSRLKAIEDQGWFNAASYKRSQGQLVRRCTVVALIGIVGCGLWVMDQHNRVLGSASWQINIPFTGLVTIKDPKDAKIVIDKLDAKEKDRVRIVSRGSSDFSEGLVVSREAFESEVERLKSDPPTARIVMNRFTYRDDVEDRLKKSYVKITNAGDEESTLSTGQVVEKVKLDSERSRLEKLGKKDKELPEGSSDKLAMPETSAEFTPLTLFPYVRFTLPLFLAALALWFSWRLVNMPVFADFLIATEAELNKVSWTTRTRLKQDTIVVLVTVVLLSIFILTMDTVWYKLLSWKPVGVLQLKRDETEKKIDIPW
jgi:preprotein translocase SecE subunit